MKKKDIKKLLTLIITFIIYIIYSKTYNYSLSTTEIPEYVEGTYIVVNDNIPEFTEEDLTTESFEKYSKLDYLGRAGVAYANVGIDLMPTTSRESIGMIKPTGYQTSKYDFVDGKYLYNRCHLIAYQLTGENANEENLITCTRHMNQDGMIPFENIVASYVKSTNNHVLYRVTPFYEGTNLLASGAKIEALSVEDNGKGVKFNVYVYNVQDKVSIDYKTGENHLIEN